MALITIPGICVVHGVTERHAGRLAAVGHFGAGRTTGGGKSGLSYDVDVVHLFFTERRAAQRKGTAP